MYLLVQHVSTFQRVIVSVNTFVHRRKEAVYVQHNIQARSHNDCCSVKAINIIYNDCVSVALVIQHAKRMRHIVVCDLSDSTVFFHFTS